MKNKIFDFTREIISANEVEYEGYIQLNSGTYNFIMTKYTNGESSFEPKNFFPKLRGAIQFLIRQHEASDFNNRIK